MKPIDAEIASLRVKMPKCSLEGSGGIEIPLEAGIYELTREGELNPNEWNLHLPDGGHATVDARVTEDGRVQVS